MKITGLEIREAFFPLKVPFITALRRVDTIPALHLTLTTDEGLAGTGAASPTAAITGDTDGSIREAVRIIADKLKDQPADDLHRLLAAVRGAIVGNTSAKAGMDMALYDLFSKKAGLPLCRFLGGSVRPFTTDLTISLREADLMAKDAVAARAMGFDTLKVKLGRNGEEDFKRFKAIRDAVDCTLRVDANQGWVVKEALRFMDRCDREGIEVDFLEQPVRAADLAGMVFIKERIACPLAADESVFSPLDALKIIEAGAADIVNIKLMKSGGIYQALKIAHLAETAGLDLMLGCMMESPVGVAAALHFASALPGIKYLDLDVPFLMKELPDSFGFRCEGLALSAGPVPGLLKE